MAYDGDTPVDFGGMRSGVRAYVFGAYKFERVQRDVLGRERESARTYEARLNEAIELCKAIDLDIVGADFAILKTLKPATYVGKGKLEALQPFLEEQSVEVVFFDCALSPIQQRNLEKELNCKVIDRTGLILEIFGRRATTKEGALQVELAHLTYQKSRLVRSWTHLERQRGGFGFLGGPGETQIEVDRRLITDRMKRIEQDLELVRKTRRLHRRGRKRVPYPVVALVGYTNAGKSTLFNALTKACVLSTDMLFATLDPTLRAVALPRGKQIILSDTVGFVSDLPTLLVAAFQSTLEEVTEADFILHVRDCSHPEWEEQHKDVRATLSTLCIDAENGEKVIEVWNKIDALDEDEREMMMQLAQLSSPSPVVTSAITGEGLSALLERIENHFALQQQTYHIELAPTEGKALAWIYRHGEVLNRIDGQESIELDVRMSTAQHGQAQAMGFFSR